MQFENRYMITKDLVRDWFKHPVKMSHVNYIGHFFLILFIGLLLLSIMYYHFYFAGFLVLLALICSYVVFFRPRVLFNIRFNSLSRIRGAKEWEMVIQLSDEISVTEGNTTTRLKWDSVLEVIDSKECFILMIDQQGGIRLKKDSFTIGDEHELANYIRKEHPDISFAIRK